MMATLVGSLLVGLACVIRVMRRTGDALAAIDQVMVLDAANTRFDRLICERLGDGTILLLRCDWLMSAASDAILRIDPHTGQQLPQPLIRRRQDMPADAYLQAEDAVRLFSAGTRSVLILS